MDVHKPKSVHSWREFAGEIVTIVIGVLIALGAEQVVEAVSWHSKVAAAETAMRLELRDDDLPQAYARIAATPCLKQRLDRIEALVERGADRATISAETHGSRPALRTWDMEAWHAALASDAASHMSAERMIRWSAPYHLLQVLGPANIAEYAQQARLQAGGAAPGGLSPLERERILTAVEELRASTANMAIASLVLLKAASDVGVLIGEPEKRRVLADMRARYGVCVVQPPPESRLDISGQGEIAGVSNIVSFQP